MKNFIFLLLLFVVSSSALVAQICEGNLGENIFTDGDFGSGTANILQTNPLIAPGYGYAINPPPTDGNYTITNNTTSWGSFATNWVNFEDNSPDPNGYMMVVNASFEPGLFYEQEVDGLCENTLYVFSVDVFNLLFSGGIKPNVSFLLDGQIVFETGDVPTNQAWNTYGFTFTTAPNQTSVTLALQNNAPGGQGNDLALDNITFRACGPLAQILPAQVANICEDGDPINLDATIDGDQYDNPAVQWQQSFDEGLTWVNVPNANSLSYPFNELAAGMYYFRYLLANGEENLPNPFCRVVSNIKIVNVVPKFYTIVDTLCTGLSFELKDSLYSETGIYVDSLTTFLGCDSIVTLDLTILDDPMISGEFTLTQPSCDYLEDASIALDNITNGMPAYSIFIDDLLDVDGIISGLGPGNYNYRIVDRFGCSLDTLINIPDASNLSVDLGEDIYLDLGDPIILDPAVSIPVENYFWTADEQSLCSEECEILYWTPANSTFLYLMVETAENGCTAIDSIQVFVNKKRDVFIPNAISPNNDGVNDYFLINASTPKVQSIVSLHIFNRWGELVYAGNDLLPNESTWDGTFRGQNLPDDIYVYVAEVQFLDGVTVIYKGDITLIK